MALPERVYRTADRLDWTAILTVTGQSLATGDVITYTFGDQSGGGRGVRAGKKAGEELVRIALDSDGDGSHTELGDLPRIQVFAQPADRLAAVAPSIVKRGTPFELAVVAQDSLHNAGRGYTGTIGFSSSDNVIFSYFSRVNMYSVNNEMDQV